MKMRDINLIDLFEHRNVKIDDNIKKLFDYIEELDIDHLSNLFMDPNLEKSYFNLKIHELLNNYKSAAELRPISEVAHDALECYYIKERDYYNDHNTLSKNVTGSILRSFVEYMIDNKASNIFIIRCKFDYEIIRKYFNFTTSEMKYESKFETQFPVALNLNVIVAGASFLIIKCK